MSHPTPETAQEPTPETGHGRRRADAENDLEKEQATVPTSVEPDEGFDPAESAQRSEAAAKKADPKRNGAWSWFKEIAIVIVIALILSFVIKTFLFRAYYIPSDSMNNTLLKDDRIFVNLLVPHPFALQRGDIVVFKDTQGWLPPAPEKSVNWVKESLTFIGLMPDESQQHLVKRVIGLPGDHVICCDAQGQITVNGKGLVEPYLYPGTDNMAGPNAIFDVTVPAGKIWVMGDNRNNSADSRWHQSLNSQGFIDQNDVEGAAGLLAWPLNRWTVLGNYPDTFRDVPAPTSTPVSSPDPVPTGK
ncbi:signal peptidase I [Renibacterium salmoninarum ATCC 33209]|uniref:Signal peptidase I n=1 Tax=Renibacterium salmoninarum (strain ATCC 33209 / DSM 20767 / JCM 11484 / NBRC 15589 / NCIMB 2235) TaxID=288705 RepID=A9WP50_RENSM|nr:signal peptidase I [Renibacterium salmoninarum]ABY22825.1 signal peptidase I [Renibacterium salmoninarum ATCC 33209]